MDTWKHLKHLYQISRSRDASRSHILQRCVKLKVSCITFTSLIPVNYYWLLLTIQRLKCLPAMRETRVRSLGWEDPLEKEMATHSSILAWRISWRSLVGYSPRGRKESDTTERLHFRIFRPFLVHLHSQIMKLCIAGNRGFNLCAKGHKTESSGLSVITLPLQLVPRLFVTFSGWKKINENCHLVKNSKGKVL